MDAAGGQAAVLAAGLRTDTNTFFPCAPARSGPKRAVRTSPGCVVRAGCRRLRPARRCACGLAQVSGVVRPSALGSGLRPGLRGDQAQRAWQHWEPRPVAGQQYCRPPAGTAPAAGTRSTPRGRRRADGQFLGLPLDGTEAAHPYTTALWQHLVHPDSCRNQVPLKDPRPHSGATMLPLHQPTPAGLRPMSSMMASFRGPDWGGGCESS